MMLKQLKKKNKEKYINLNVKINFDLARLLNKEDKEVHKKMQ